MDNHFKNLLSTLTTLLKNIDDEFSPSISKQEGSIENYIERIRTNGSVLYSYKNDELRGIIIYFKNSDAIDVNLLWIRPDNRNTSTLYSMIRDAVSFEDDYNNMIRVRTSDKNHKAIRVIEKLGFSLVDRIPEDKLSGCTTLLYESKYALIRKYFKIN